MEALEGEVDGTTVNKVAYLRARTRARDRGTTEDIEGDEKDG